MFRTLWEWDLQQLVMLETNPSDPDKKDQAKSAVAQTHSNVGPYCQGTDATM